MLGNIPVIALAALSAVQASPLHPRQATSSIISAASSVLASATSAAASSVEASASSATAAVGSATSAAASAAANASSSAAAAVSPSAAANTTTGNQTYGLYPCPTGYLLTYVSQNITVPVPVGEVVAAFGSWANSTFFPNVTDVVGAADVGASHTINVGGLSLAETLVNVTLGGASGSAAYTWNLTNGPVTGEGVSFSNYSTVLSIYDPGFTATNTTGSNTTLLSYTNFCASEQTAGQALVGTLTSLELGTLAQAVAAGSSNATVSSAVASTAAAATSAAGASASSIASAASSSASSATSGIAESATSVLESASSVAASAVSAATAAASSAVSSAA